MIVDLTIREILDRCGFNGMPPFASYARLKPNYGASHLHVSFW
jgi:hypothetical protein